MSGGFYQDFWTIDSIQGYPIHLHPMLHPKVASSAWEETYLPLGGSGPTGGFLAKKLIFSNEISGGGGLLSEKWRCQVGMWDFSWWWGARKFFQNLVVVQRNEEGSTITYHLHQGSLYYQPKLHTLFTIFPQNPSKSPAATFEHHQLWSPSPPKQKRWGVAPNFFMTPYDLHIYVAFQATFGSCHLASHVPWYMVPWLPSQPWSGWSPRSDHLRCRSR